jgi:hypothetical protein
MTEQPDNIKPLSDVLAEMRPDEHFEGMDTKRREILLRELYIAALGKAYSELKVQLSKSKVPAYRGMRERISNAIPLLKHAADDIAKAVGYLTYVGGPEDYVMAIPEDDTKIPSHLLAKIEYLIMWERVYAAVIHPKLRNEVEKRLAGGNSELTVDPQTKIVHAGPISVGDYPDPDGKLVFIDQWFVGEVAACLDMYRQLNGHKITGYASIIQHLFRAAFGERRELDAISRALNRQKKCGRPKLVITPFHLKTMPWSANSEPWAPFWASQDEDVEFVLGPPPPLAGPTTS